MSVTIHEVTKYYGKQKALDQVGFILNSGEICGFLGPNGAGKSTLMKIVTGYIDEYEGEVTLEGISLRKDPLKARALTGYLPEHNPLYPEMYIREYLQHVARLYRIPKPAKRTGEVMEWTGLLPEDGKKIGQLSKGYRQRVGLAQALIHDPQILILDEPMTGLDPNQLEDIRTLITRIGRDKTVMLSTHIMQEVEAICDRIVVINKGEIVADRPKELFRRQSGGTTVEVCFSAPTDGNWLQELAGVEKVERTEGNRYRYRLKTAPNTDPRIDLFREAVRRNLPIIELRTEEGTLEELFRELTQ